MQAFPDELFIMSCVDEGALIEESDEENDGDQEQAVLAACRDALARAHPVFVTDYKQTLLREKNFSEALEAAVRTATN